MEQLAIEGMGLISCLGDGVDRNFQQLLGGVSGLKRLQYFAAANFNARHAYEIAAVPGQRTDLRATRQVCAAIRQAVTQAGLDDDAIRHVPIIVGTGLRELRTVEQWHCDGIPMRPHQLHFASAVREQLGSSAPCYTLSNACAASLYALGVGEDMLRLGYAQRVIVAGCDVLTESMFGLLDRVQLSTPGSVQPFSVDRKGVLMGDGAVALVLSRPEAARAPLAWLESVGLNCDAHHETAPSTSGIAEAIRIAHRRSGVDVTDIDLIYMHGTGTQLNDTAEATAVSEVFGAPLATAGKTLPVTAIKSMTGHTSGASGLSSLVIGVKSMQTGSIPGTPGCNAVIPELDDPIKLVQASRLADIGRVQINAFGFGGVNAVALIAGKVGQKPAQPTKHPVPVAITGIGPLFADAPPVDACALLGRLDRQVADPVSMLGRKGLRQKDRATQLALCAAVSCLADAGLPVEATDQLEPETLAVVVSSNTGNIDTVCRVSAQIREGGVANTSPLDLPNASSNIVSSAIAIRIGARQANLMICNGASSGLDALHLAHNLIAAGRAARVVVVGVETDNEFTRALFGEERSGCSAPTEAAIGIVVEREDDALDRGRPPYARLGRQCHGPDADLATHRRLVDEAGGKAASWWVTAGLAGQGAPDEGLEGHALPESADAYYGALGIMQSAAAARYVADTGRSALISCGGGDDAVATQALHPAS